MLLSELVAGLDRLIPFRYAEAWDKVGLQIGNPERPVRRVRLALDLTAEAIAAARAEGADLVLCHHPPIFSPLAGLRFDHLAERLPCLALEANLAVVALHTNLDAVPGGVADQFATMLGLQDVQTFVPLPEPVERPEGPWAAAFPTAPGFGRTGRLCEALPLAGLVRLLRNRLATPCLMVSPAAGKPLQGEMVRHVTVCPGSFDGDWAGLLARQPCDVLVTGEIKYHDRLAVTAAGIPVIAVGHDVSERLVLQPLAKLLAGTWPDLAFAVEPGIDYNEMAF